VLKSIVQSQSLSTDTTQSPLSLVSKLAQRIEEFHHPQAKACVIWLVGQYAPDNTTSAGVSSMMSWAPDTLRRTAKAFVTEVGASTWFIVSVVDRHVQTALVKLQIITLAAKLVVLDPSHQTLILLARYALSLARYDADYDVRDRARMLLALLRGVAPGVADEDESVELAGVILRREQVRVVLFDGKLAPKTDDMSRRAYQASYIIRI
jgi:AP-3 complex subunit beta